MEMLADSEAQEGPRTVRVKKGSVEEKAFAESRKDELYGLLRDETFVQTREKDIYGEPRIFGSRFVNELKKVGKQLRKKSLLVAQNYADKGAASIATKALRFSAFLSALPFVFLHQTPVWRRIAATLRNRIYSRTLLWSGAYTSGHRRRWDSI